MKKQVKFLSLVAFAAVAISNANVVPQQIDPYKNVDKVSGLLDRTDKYTLAGLVGGAVVVSEAADLFAHREYDDKAEGFTVTGDTTNVMVANALHNLSQGMGYTALDHALLKEADQIGDWKSLTQEVVLSGLGSYAADTLSKANWFKSISRNTPGFRWVPTTTVKFDNQIKKIAVMYAVNRLGTAACNYTLSKISGNTVVAPAVVVAPATGA